MGDVGSLALGFIVAALLVYGTGTGSFTLPVALMITALFLVDATLTLVVGEGDLTISPRQAERIRSRLASARVVRFARLGHLAHEEAAGEIARVICELAGVPPASRR